MRRAADCLVATGIHEQNQNSRREPHAPGVWFGSGSGEGGGASPEPTPGLLFNRVRLISLSDPLTSEPDRSVADVVAPRAYQSVAADCSMSSR